MPKGVGWFVIKWLIFLKLSTLGISTYRFDLKIWPGGFTWNFWVGDLTWRFGLKIWFEVLTSRFDSEVFRFNFFHLKFFYVKVWVRVTWRFGLEFWIEVWTCSFDLVFSLGVLTWRFNLKFWLEVLSFGPLNAKFELIYWQVNLQIDNFDIFPNFDLKHLTLSFNLEIWLRVLT